MDLRTEGVPTRRVLTGDDGAPLDEDRVLALALRWGDRPISLEHVRPGTPRTPVDGVAFHWEGRLPVIALAEGLRAWVEREGKWVEPGRRVALELGEVLVVSTGELVLEARLQRRSERLPKTGRHESLFFALVVTHCLMIFAAVAVALVITPRVDEPSMWGAPGLVLRLASTPFTAVPERQTPRLEDRVKEVVARATVRDFSPETPTKKNSAMSVLQRLLGGGGGGGVFGGGLGNGIDAALENLGGPGHNAMAGDGLTGVNARNLGGGIGGNGLSLGGPIGPGRGDGPPGPGLRGHHAEVVVCRDCNLSPQGYDRELILKVVRRHQNEIRFCYESELQKLPELAGKVTVAWIIGPTGSVDSAEIAESGLGNANVEACIVQKVRRWSFPEPKGGQEVAITFPWVFHFAGGE